MTDSAPSDEALLRLNLKDALEALAVYLDFPFNLTIAAEEFHTVHNPRVVCCSIACLRASESSKGIFAFLLALRGSVDQVS